MTIKESYKRIRWKLAYRMQRYGLKYDDSYPTFLNRYRLATYFDFVGKTKLAEKEWDRIQKLLEYMDQRKLG